MRFAWISDNVSENQQNFKAEFQQALERMLVSLAHVKLRKLPPESLPWVLTITHEKDLWDHIWRVKVETLEGEG